MDLLVALLDLLADGALFVPALVVCFLLVFIVIRAVNFAKQVRRRRKHKPPVYYTVQETPAIV